MHDSIYLLYVHIFRFEQNHQERLQEIKIVARLLVLDPNHNANLISSNCLLGNKLVYSGYKTMIGYKTSSHLESVWLILTNPVPEPQFPLLQKRSRANCKAFRCEWWGPFYKTLSKDPSSRSDVYAQYSLQLSPYEFPGNIYPDRGGYSLFIVFSLKLPCIKDTSIRRMQVS